MNNSFMKFMASGNPKQTDAVTSNVKLINALGGTAVVVLGLVTASLKLAQELKK